MDLRFIGKRDIQQAAGRLLGYTIDRLKKRGYVPLAEMYNQMVLKLAILPIPCHKGWKGSLSWYAE